VFERFSKRIPRKSDASRVRPSPRLGTTFPKNSVEEVREPEDAEEAQRKAD
jgi:hypothetical protein